jgi:carbon storage regulator CsrA
MLVWNRKVMEGICIGEWPIEVMVMRLFKKTARVRISNVPENLPIQQDGKDDKYQRAVLTLRTYKPIKIGEDITITVVSLVPNSVRIAVDSKKNTIGAWRKEVYDAVIKPSKENKATSTIEKE